MCELFALSSRLPSRATFSFEEFARHGGETGPHADGWGVAAYEDRDVRLLREPLAASRSPCVRYLQEHGLRSDLILSHVRRATQGAHILPNTQPFVRELGGHVHAFAHNGDLAPAAALPLGRFRPVGETDSERAFCSLLARLAPLWENGRPPVDQRLEIVNAFAAELRELGPANFLYADGEVIFAHAHRRRHGSEESPRPPGLHLLERTCACDPEFTSPHGLRVEAPCGPQRVLLLASVPLSAEAWTPLAEGELLAIARGEVLRRVGAPLPDGP
ncbi:MAG: class II glutamine amidotransferase [Planctomycetota bacterium]|nr:MAG: class II glutamine amidotransferase [Planctomycetota bacterium]